MSARAEAERMAFGLAAAGIAYLGTYGALFSMALLGLNSGAPVAVFTAFLVGVPTLLVVVALWALRAAVPFPLHPLTTALGAVLGGLLSIPFFQVLGFTGLLGMPALLTFAAFMLAQFLLNRPALSGPEIALHSAAGLLFYSFFAASPLAIAFGLVDTTGCDGCGKTESLITAMVVLSLAFIVILASATRYRPRARPPKDVSMEAGAIP